MKATAQRGEEKSSVSAYDFLGGAAAAVAALAVDPGDDRVRLGAVLHARAQDVLHRLTEQIVVSS